MVVPARYRDLAQELARADGFELEQMRGQNPSEIATRRRIAIALCEAGASYSEAGEVLGRHHTSVMNLVKAKPPARRERVA